MLGFTDKFALILYVPKKYKSVLLLLFKIVTDEINQKHMNNSQIIEYYNKTKCAVDTGDKKAREYSCVRATRCQPMRIFMEMLDIATLNGYVIWTTKYTEKRKNILSDKGRRKSFLRKLGTELVKDNVEEKK